MLDKNTKDIENLLEWYDRSKEIVIIAESMDKINGSYVQPMHELRYCLDHFMRSILFDLENKEEKTTKAISSAIGHLQRTYSDSIEWISICVCEDFQTTLGEYTKEQINSFFPNYYKEIRIELEKIKKIVNNYKINKSIEVSTEISDEELEMLKKTSYELMEKDVCKKLQTYLEELHIREPLLIEERERDRRTNWLFRVLYPVLAAVASGFIVSLIK